MHIFLKILKILNYIIMLYFTVSYSLFYCLTVFTTAVSTTAIFIITVFITAATVISISTITVFYSCCLLYLQLLLYSLLILLIIYFTYCLFYLLLILLTAYFTYRCCFTY